MMPIPDAPHTQMDDAAFYEVEGPYGIEYAPIDDHALYGWVQLGGRTKPEEIPHRNSTRDIITAIDTLAEGDRLRINDKNWMVVLRREMGSPVVRLENGSVEYEVWARYSPDRIDVDPGPRLFKANGFKSAGRVHCLEVDWVGPRRE